jgi:lipoprotein-anchoring transpeptidase ErfK/SrfK
MMIRCVGSLARAAILAAGVVAAVSFATMARGEVPQQTKVNVAWQIALEDANFSPGIIDGAWGRKGKLAITEYAKVKFPDLASPYDKNVLESLKVDVDNAFVKYTVTADDLAQVGGPLPDDWNLKSSTKIQKMAYESISDALTERFHCTRTLMQSLNAGVALDGVKPGDALMVPNVRPFPTSWVTKVPPTVAESSSVSVDLAEKTIRVYDAAGKQLALFHCSVAKDKAKLPARDATVEKIAVNPEYSFDPRNWPEVHNVTGNLTIPAGPRNPVGLIWIGLDLKGYGMHGNPKPELIGKTGSHGCFRLTNWDAIRYTSFVRVGMTVKMVNPEVPGAPTPAP